MRNLATTAAMPAQEAVAALWFWARGQWVQSRAWRITAISVSTVIVLTVCHLINTSMAMADAGSGTASQATFFLDLSNQTDTHGIGVWRYTTLFLDYGQASTPGRLVRGVFIGLAWLIYVLGLFLVLALVKFILDFTWLEWLLSPVLLLANTIRDILSQTGIMTLGLTVSALVIAIGFLRGKKSAAIVEFFAVALIFGFASTPAIGNPTQLVEGQGSWIQQSRDWGVELGNLTVQRQGGKAVTGNPISAEIIDQTLRRPSLYVSFGSELSGDCAAKFDTKMQDGTDAEGIRKQVTGCSDDAKKANETDSWVALGVLGIFYSGTTAIMFLVGVFVFFLIKDATLAILGLVNVVARAHFAPFPGGGRFAFINAFGQMIVNIVMICLYIWLLSAYLRLVDLILKAIPGSALVMGNFIIGVVIIVMVYTFFRLKKSGKGVAKRIAEALGRSGLNGSSAPREPSNLTRTLKKQGLRVLGNKLGGGATPKPRLFQPPAPVPIRVPGQPNGRGPASLARLALAAGSAVTTGGTSLALQAASSTIGAITAGKGGPKTALSAAAGAATAVLPANQQKILSSSAEVNIGQTSSHRQDSSTAAGNAGLHSSETARSGRRRARVASEDGVAGASEVPLVGRVVDRVPRDVRRIPVYEAPASGRGVPAAGGLVRKNAAAVGPMGQGAGLIRQPPPGNGFVRV